MRKIDRRKYPRVKICKTISYDCIDEKGNVLDQNMGIALDISQNGILLETAFMIESQTILLLFVDLENQLMEIIGKVVFSVKSKSGKFKSGINFQGTPEENIQFAMNLVKTFHYIKSDHFLKMNEKISPVNSPVGEI